MATEIKSRRYTWGKLYLRGDMVHAVMPVFFRYEDDDPNNWRPTPFQTANASHDWRRAFALVNDWLKGQHQ